MKKKKILLVIVFVFSLLLCTFLSSCGNSKLEFKDATVVADGSTKSIEVSGNIPSGCTVEYVNNTGTTAGDYYATAYIKDANGNVVNTLYATLTIDNPDSAAFEAYLDQFFIEYLEGDQLSINIFCEKPENFGLDHYETAWYTYSGFTDEDIVETQTLYNELASELETFDYDSLSERQKIAYEQIDDFISYNQEHYSIDDILYMQLLYVDQFGGYVADFGTYLEAYTIRTSQDVEDIINYVSSTKEAFSSYVNFVKDKAEKGYPLTDYTITEMTNYLDDVLAEGMDYYLLEVLKTNINSSSVIDKAAKQDSISRLTSAFEESFIPGVEALRDGIQNYKGLATKEGYWNIYENGKKVYELELKDLLGLPDLNMSQYIAELDAAIADTNKREQTALEQIIRAGKIISNEQLEEYLASHLIYDATPEKMMDYLKKFAKTIVPDLKTTPKITIKEMDEASAKVSNAVAYYMKSALDNKSQEFITLNPVKLGDKNDVLGTLAHEGYPGHLYAYTYSKQLDLHNISKIMTSTAHGEGWATYVELALYEYALERASSSADKAVIRYLYANQLAGFLLETRLDVAIHYQNWNVGRIATYLGNLGYNSDAAEDIYRLLIETPASYAAYGYGKLFFVRLHNEAKSYLGENYDEKEFNAMLLSKGWTSLGKLNETYQAYMKKKCHKLGIEFPNE
ncbi:MAG: DUF885 domain-containing protein [Anaeroplasmataceae bacterium]|nr:DUF885 domain-containing protein [Anaeroplasmataceae bacterium]